MTSVLEIEPLVVPLRTDETGTVRVGQTRVTLETVVATYEEGCTPEEIVRQYPALSLADAYAAVSYYLTHPAEVKAYLAQQERKATAARARWPRTKPTLKERLLERRRAQEEQG